MWFGLGSEVGEILSEILLDNLSGLDCCLGKERASLCPFSWNCSQFGRRVDFSLTFFMELFAVRA